MEVGTEAVTSIFHAERRFNMLIVDVLKTQYNTVTSKEVDYRDLHYKEYFSEIKHRQPKRVAVDNV